MNNKAGDIYKRFDALRSENEILKHRIADLEDQMQQRGTAQAREPSLSSVADLGLEQQEGDVLAIQNLCQNSLRQPILLQDVTQPVIFAGDTSNQPTTSHAYVTDHALNPAPHTSTNNSYTQHLSKEQYRIFIEQSNDFISQIDHTWHFVYLNKQATATLGIAASECYGKSFFDFVDPADQTWIKQEFQNAQLQQAPYMMWETCLISLSGHRYYFLWNGHILYANNGHISGINVTGRDITRRRAEETALCRSHSQLEVRLRERTAKLSEVNAEIARSVRAKDEFLATISHEFRTPLNAILGLTQVLHEGVYGTLTSDQCEMLSMITASGKRLITLVNAILDISRIEAGKFELLVGRIKVDALCRSVLEGVQEKADEKGITISYNLNNIEAKMLADERRLRQILNNLLENAIAFTQQKGTIGLDVELNTERDEIQFSVWDHGSGIASEHMDRLFQPFTQLDSSLTRCHHGVGLGLALAGRLIELHGGSIVVESEVGVGSRFIVSLPRLYTRGTPDQTHPSLGNTDIDSQENVAFIVKIGQDTFSPDTITHAEHQSSILLIENNEHVIQMVLNQCRSTRYHFVVARNGLEAFDLIREERPALILLNIHIRGLSGFEILRRLRNDPQFHPIPIYALSSLERPGDRERCLRAGIVQYFRKPLFAQELQQAINTILVGNSDDQDV